MVSFSSTHWRQTLYDSSLYCLSTQVALYIPCLTVTTVWRYMHRDIILQASLLLYFMSVCLWAYSISADALTLPSDKLCSDWVKVHAPWHYSAGIASAIPYVCVLVDVFCWCWHRDRAAFVVDRLWEAVPLGRSRTAAVWKGGWGWGGGGRGGCP